MTEKKANKPNLDGYVEVHDRIEAFYEKFPEGSLQSDWHLTNIGETPCIVAQARAFRTADDPRPGIGFASEPIPGRTPYTKDSELMNAETSAWGRALAALGFKVKDGIATGNEIRARQGSGGDGPPKPSAKQLEFLESLVGKKGVGGEELGVIMAYAAENLTGGKGGSCSKLIDRIKENDAEKLAGLREAAAKWAASKSGLPADESDLHEAPTEQEAMPF